jgi:transposase
VQRDQQFLMPPSMRDWLAASDPVWLVISAVAQLDTSALHAQRCTSGAGHAGYDPDMLLTLLMWVSAQGVRSWRVIERLCGRDVAFRIFCAGDAPDHVTISRFRAEAAAVMEQLRGCAARLGCLSAWPFCATVLFCCGGHVRRAGQPQRLSAVGGFGRSIRRGRPPSGGGRLRDPLRSEVGNRSDSGPLSGPRSCPIRLLDAQ